MLNMAHTQQLSSKETKLIILTLSKAMRLSRMELKSIQNTVKFFKDSGLKLSALITDRRQQIQQWVRGNMVGLLHCCITLPAGILPRA